MPKARVAMGTAQHSVAVWAPASPLPQSSPLQHPQMPGGCSHALHVQQALCPSGTKGNSELKGQRAWHSSHLGPGGDASPLAGSQAAPVLIPIHGTFQVLRKPLCASSRRCRSGMLHPKCQGTFPVVLGQKIHSPRTEQSPWVS